MRGERVVQQEDERNATSFGIHAAKCGTEVKNMGLDRELRFYGNLTDRDSSC